MNLKGDLGQFCEGQLYYVSARGGLCEVQPDRVHAEFTRCTQRSHRGHQWSIRTKRQRSVKPIGLRVALEFNSRVPNRGLCPLLGLHHLSSDDSERSALEPPSGA
ncbi:hypothetical protein WMY93_010789 [Mugilogobius chulae]|uniref:Uncharacterized protein n=1 Tax=Mugilogobius chulae TaxID=88201 RepID=A0AAW0P8N6_9GOBI